MGALERALGRGVPRMGKYRVVRRLAEGGMGEIFLGVARGESGFEKVVVLKRILGDKLRDPELVRMFMDEARLMAALNHPNIVQVYDFGSSEGAHFFAMEYVHGEDVAGIMSAATLAGQTLPLELGIGIIADAAAGLHYAHEKTGPDGAPLQIVHRDISPSNLLVSYEGAVKLTDFGIAKWNQRQTETRHGGIKGKIAYMSPEQCRAGLLDRRSDVFGLGILLYELTTGTRLFQGASDFAVLEQIVHQDAPRPRARRPDYPAAVEEIVMRALARDPERRQQTARDLQLELEEYARENKLAISGMARASHMQALFAAKIEAWREAEHAGRSLGEHLADERPITRPEVEGTATEVRGRGRWKVAAATLALTVLGAGAVSVVGQRRPAPAPAVAPPAVTVPVAARPQPHTLVTTPPREPEASSSEPVGRAPSSASRRHHRRVADVAPSRPPAPSPPPPLPPVKKIWDPDSIYLP